MIEDNEDDETQEPNIGEITSDFVDNITCLATTLPVTTEAMINAFQEALKRLEEFESKKVIHKQKTDHEELSMKIDDLYEWIDLTKQPLTYGTALKIVPRSLMVSLVSQYDAFLGNLLKAILTIKPEMLNTSEKALTFAQLMEFGSVENAKEYVLEKEVESVLRKSHVEHFTWMEAKFNMSLRKDLTIWPRFIELTERRNLFVHTDGIISSQYIKICKENYVTWETEPKLGDELEVSEKYFQDAVNIIFEIGVKLAQVLWRKFKPTDLKEADKNLLDIAFDLLKEENYELAKALFNFATNILKKHHSEEYRKIFIVNQALAYKWSGEDQKARAIITKEDWSDTRDKFRLAEAVILENDSMAFQIMRKIGANNDEEVSKMAYRSQWPLFKIIRTKPEFCLVYEEIFGEPFNNATAEELESVSNIHFSEELESNPSDELLT